PGTEPYYPINDDRNVAMHEEYMSMARTETPDVLFAGRLGAYKYLDMDQVIGEVLTYWK
ncbi:MAG: UDP-galactopyranose mutase, partial [Bacteroidaceae bacterium]|nr:UDP-galactopyranose mutase [Bacteroidaceae bacterium]